MNIFESSFILLITFLIAYQYSKIVKIKRKRAIKLFLWHTLFCFICTQFSIQNQLDAYGYYVGSQDISSVKYVDFLSNTGFIFTFNSIFSNYLGLGIYSCALIFSLIGGIGVITMDAIITSITKDSNPKIKILYELFIWSPSLHFWTSSIGKDAILFTSINLILYAFLKPRRRFLIILPCFILVAIIRPHIGIVLLFSIIGATFSRIEIPRNYRLLIRLIIILGFSYFISLGIDFLNLGTANIYGDQLNFEKINNLIKYQRTITEVGNYSIDMNSLNVPLRLFAYMFRPLFLDSNGLLGIVASIDNLVLLSIFIYPILLAVTKKRIPIINFSSVNIFLIIFICFSWFFLSSTTSNLGLALRHKLMFVVPLVYSLTTITKGLRTDNNIKNFNQSKIY